MSAASDYMHLCRLCLVKEKVNVPIFGETSDVQQIFLKISACLPVKVSQEDRLPKNICDSCVNKIDLLYQFWNTTVSAEKQLLQWLDEVVVDPKNVESAALRMLPQSHAHPHSTMQPETILLKEERPDPDLNCLQTQGPSIYTSDYNVNFQQEQTPHAQKRRGRPPGSGNKKLKQDTTTATTRSSTSLTPASGPSNVDSVMDDTSNDRFGDDMPDETDDDDDDDDDMDADLSGTRIAKFYLSVAQKMNISPKFVSVKEEDSRDEVSISKRAKRVDKKWTFEQSFINKEYAENVVNAEACWGLIYTNKAEAGISKIYRCKRVKRRGRQCAAALKLVFDSGSDSVHMFRTEASHTCDEIESKAALAMSDEVKGQVRVLFQQKLKPKSIFEYFATKYEFPPSFTQIKNFIAGLKKSIYGPPAISLGELDSWLKLHSTIPDEDSKAFILNHYTNVEDGGIFRFLVSSKTLLQNATKPDIFLHADATYKLTWQGFPVLLLGTTDRDRKFHILGMAVCSNEQQADYEFLFQSLKSGLKKIHNYDLKPKVLVADAAQNIRNGFVNVFGKGVIRMCWAHMKENVQKISHILVQKENVHRIMTDIEALQICENGEVFEIAFNLFLKKWSEEVAFVEYFKGEWYHKNPNWFEGACPATPSTNNALESTSRVIKNEITFRERLPLSCFCKLILETIEKFSRQYDCKLKVFSDFVTIDSKTWTRAYEWVRLKKKLELVPNETSKEFLVPAGETQEVMRENIVKMYADFDDFKNKKFSYWKVNLPMENDKWKDGCCTCPSFLKTYICKHIIGIAIIYKYVQAPPEIKHLPVGVKRKRGRPSKAQKALIVL